MNRNLTTKLKEFICIKCHCEHPKLIHNIWYENKHQKLCTSCVLFTCKEFYCPTCFGVHGLISKGKLVRCKRCNSRSHPDCFPSNSSMCLSCIDPIRLIFNPKELRLKDFDRIIKAVDEKAMLLFFTASKVGNILMCKASEVCDCDAEVAIAKAVVCRKKSKLGVERALRDHDLKNKNRNLESFLDFTDSEDEDDSSCETLSDGGRMKKLGIEGEVSKDVIRRSKNDGIKKNIGSHH